MGFTSSVYGNNVYSLKAINHKRRKDRKRKLASKAVPHIVQSPTRLYKPDPFYDSREWFEVRYKALRIHGPRCQCCGRSRQDNITIHVDHIKPRSKYPALALDVNNLQILCHECNIGKSNKDATDWR